jgi:[ribosomal protein S5]-alanine N-acetyltransferase
MTFETTIETPRLLLRPVMRYDAPVLHQALSDPAVMRYWSTPPHSELAETETWIAESMAAMARGDAHDFAVLHQNEVIGRVAFWMGDEIGFFFLRRAWGKGFAREAALAVLRYGFDTLGLRQVRADVDPDNVASLRLLEAVGFRRTGFAKNTLKVGEAWVDSVYLTLLPADLPRRDAA